jgi:hypothetical protein
MNLISLCVTHYTVSYDSDVVLNLALNIVDNLVPGVFH